MSFPAWIVATLAMTLIPAGLWLLASLRFLPHPAGAGWHDLLPGALFVGLGVEALHVFTVVWVSRSFESKSETYGAIGGSLALLLWAYVVGRVLAGSAVLNAVVWRRHHPMDDMLPAAPAQPWPAPTSPAVPPPPGVATWPGSVLAPPSLLPASEPGLPPPHLPPPLPPSR